MKKIAFKYFNYIVCSVVIFTLTTVVACSNSNDQPTIEKRFSADTPGQLIVKTSGGGIKVYGQEGNEVIVQAFIRKNGKMLTADDPEIENLDDGYQLFIGQEGKIIHAEAKRIENNLPWKHTSVSFCVYIPHEMSCELNTSGGGIKLSDVTGEQNIHTSGGGIKLKNISGNTNAHTSGGSIKIENIDGNTDVHTSGGGISVYEGKGSIKAHTSGGGIHLENIHGEINAHTSGGGIKINGSANYVKATTSGGHITADISGLSSEMYLETSGGGIDAIIPGGQGYDIDLKANDVDMELENFSGSAKKGRINGTLNGGGIPVYIHTSGGNIDITYK